MRSGTRALVFAVRRKSRSYLRIREVRDSDAGSYQCTAVNVLGRAVSNVTTVIAQTGQCMVTSSDANETYDQTRYVVFSLVLSCLSDDTRERSTRPSQQSYNMHITSWVRRPLWVNQLGQLSLPSLRGR